MGRFDLPDPETLRAREKLVLDHIHDEGTQQWDDVLSTFPHPYYELIATMRVYDGEEGVRGYWAESRGAFPDQNHELISLRHCPDAVIVEFWLTGTHLGPLNGIPATGQRFRMRMTASFIFDEQENLVCERAYFDTMTMLRQLMGGLNMKNPRNWLWLIRALRGLSKMSSTPDPRLLDTTPPDLSH
ncbi:ester cyclase [Catenuloplanes sp. NPDC051500]|uniref:ester cyclase n=1 Tax=Catenuloplanes sp. NPDC051500 TaxID=3363959 RepID=UPI0037A0FB0C